MVVVLIKFTCNSSSIIDCIQYPHSVAGIVQKKMFFYSIDMNNDILTVSSDICRAVQYK